MIAKFKPTVVEYLNLDGNYTLKDVQPTILGEAFSRVKKSGVSHAPEKMGWIPPENEDIQSSTNKCPVNSSSGSIVNRTHELCGTLSSLNEQSVVSNSMHQPPGSQGKSLTR